MMLQLFTVYDSKAESFLPPFTSGNVAIAQRNVADCLKEKDHPFSKNSEDYTLFHLGSWDDSSAVIAPLIPPRNLGVLDQYRVL